MRYPMIEKLRATPPERFSKIGNVYKLDEERGCDRGPCDRQAFFVLEVAQGTHPTITYKAPVSEVTPESLLMICLCLPCMVDALAQFGAA